MNPRPTVLLALLLGIALAFVLPFEPARPGKKKGKGPAAAPRVGGVWSDARFLTSEMEDACNVVQTATGNRFVERPTVRVSDAVAVADVLRADMHDAFVKLGAENDEQVAAMCKQLAEQLVAVYDPNENVVHVVPAHAVRAAEVAQDDAVKSREVLRLLLHRMGVIAIDRQTYPEWKAALDSAPTPDAVHAAGAILEGHAQFEVERIAKHSDLLTEFAHLVTLLTTPAPDSGGPLVEEVQFAIVKGHAFMQALAKNRGRGGVVKHLKQPPLDRAPILDPVKYFAVPPPRKADPDKSLKEFAALLGEGWTSETLERSRDEAQALLAPLKPSVCATVMAGFENGHALVATHAERKTKFTATVLQFRSGGLAEAFVGMLKGARRGGEVEEGAGRDSGLPGFARKRTTGEGDDESSEWDQWTFEGRYVMGFVTDDASIEREQQDDALEAATEAVRKKSTRRRRGR